MTQTMAVWPVEMRKPKDLLPYENNPRKITAKQLKKLQARIESQGFRAPPSLDQDGTILAGHQRVRVLIEMGLGDMDIPCSIAPHKLSEDERKEVVVADNISFGDWDKEKLLQHWDVDDLLDWGIDERLLGATDRKNKPDGDPDEAPEVQVQALSRPGDLFQIGPHRLVCGSATEPADMQKLIGGQKVDMVFTDPPYNVAYVGKQKSAMTIKNDKMDPTAFREFLTAAYVQMAASMKQGASIYVAHADTEGENFRAAFREAGFKLSGCISWVKDSFVLGRSPYQWQHEPILFGWLSGGAHAWYGDRKQTTVWNITRPKRADEHPTMKPVALIEKALTNSSKEEDLVLDSFGGSGSTMVACHTLNRAARLMELDPRYVDVIVLRMRKLFPALEITCNGQPLAGDWAGRQLKGDGAPKVGE